MWPVATRPGWHPPAVPLPSSRTLTRGCVMRSSGDLCQQYALTPMAEGWHRPWALGKNALRLPLFTTSLATPPRAHWVHPVGVSVAVRVMRPRPDDGIASEHAITDTRSPSGTNQRAGTPAEMSLSSRRSGSPHAAASRAILGSAKPMGEPRCRQTSAQERGGYSSPSLDVLRPI